MPFREPTQRPPVRGDHVPEAQGELAPQAGGGHAIGHFPEAQGQAGLGQGYFLQVGFHGCFLMANPREASPRRERVLAGAMVGG